MKEPIFMCVIFIKKSPENKEYIDEIESQVPYSESYVLHCSYVYR